MYAYIPIWPCIPTGVDLWKYGAFPLTRIRSRTKYDVGRVDIHLYMYLCVSHVTRGHRCLLKYAFRVPILFL